MCLWSTFPDSRRHLCPLPTFPTFPIYSPDHRISSVDCVCSDYVRLIPSNLHFRSIVCFLAILAHQFFACAYSVVRWKQQKFVLQPSDFLPPLCFDIPCLIPTTSLVLASSSAPSLYMNLLNVEKSLITLSISLSLFFTSMLLSIHAAFSWSTLPNVPLFLCFFLVSKKPILVFIFWTNFICTLSTSYIVSRASLHTEYFAWES